MVTLLAKNAVQIKCGFENAIMTGNYEWWGSARMR